MTKIMKLAEATHKQNLATIITVIDLAPTVAALAIAIDLLIFDGQLFLNNVHPIYLAFGLPLVLVVISLLVAGSMKRKLGVLHWLGIFWFIIGGFAIFLLLDFARTYQF